MPIINDIEANAVLEWIRAVAASYQDSTYTGLSELATQLFTRMRAATEMQRVRAQCMAAACLYVSSVMHAHAALHPEDLSIRTAGSSSAAEIIEDVHRLVKMLMCYSADLEYVIAKRIQRGEVSDVYMAATHDGTKVIVKRFELNSLGLPISAFLMEAMVYGMAVRDHTHPHIAQCLALRYTAEGCTEMVLRAYPTPFPTGKHDDAARLASELHSALLFLASRGISHRDLKPQNMAIDASGGVRLFDFDSCSPMSTERTTCPITTITTRAPEVLLREAQGDTATPYCTAKIDVWSLGAIYHQLLYGSTLGPRQNLTAAQALIHVHDRLLRFYEDHDEDAPAVLKQCLQRDPRRRPALGDIFLK